jgi:beta-glucosidase
MDSIERIIQQMTLEEKASLCSGLNFWFLKGIERLGVPSIMVTDGPHGLRKQVGAADMVGLNGQSAGTDSPPLPLWRQAGTAIWIRSRQGTG